MHMADALISPTVGGTMWAVSAGTIAYCSRNVRSETCDRKVPLMGVLGAFVFAAQMINFTIPVTGSSGHLGGGLLLAILLGPHAAFLVIASVLFVQALLFADGGLLALGCNIFNIGFFPAFIAYPFVYRKLVNGGSTRGRVVFATTLAAIAALQMGAFGVVTETVLSGISELPFSPFVLLMQPIHLAIGIVEGLATAALISFVLKARPEIVERPLQASSVGQPPRTLAVGLLAATFITGGVISWYASEKPDGLEWAVARVAGKEELRLPRHGIHEALASLQEKTAPLPDYSFKSAEGDGEARTGSKDEKRAGTSVSGILGGGVTLVLAFVIGFLLKRRGAAP